MPALKLFLNYNTPTGVDLKKIQLENNCELVVASFLSIKMIRRGFSYVLLDYGLTGMCLENPMSFPVQVNLEIPRTLSSTGELSNNSLLYSLFGYAVIQRYRIQYFLKISLGVIR